MDSSPQNSCIVCGYVATSKCSRCKMVYYCSRECQKKHWPKHKKECTGGGAAGQQKEEKSAAPGPTAPAVEEKKVPLNQNRDSKQIGKMSNEMIDKDNLKLDESVGTFRWNDAMTLLPAPEWKQEFSGLLPQLNGGWEVYVQERFQYTAKPGSNEIVVQPHQLDGLSFSMTLVRLIALIRMYKHKEVDFVIMGASAKVEERLFVRTNYYEELTNFYPDMKLKFYFTGPELSLENNGKTIEKNARLSGVFYRGMTSDFLGSLGHQTGGANDYQEIFKVLDKKKTLFLGYNPGFGSGYEALLQSWAQDIVQLLDLRYPIFFTQANDFSDLKGEIKVFETVFDNKVKFTLAPEKNPFRAMTHYQGEGDAGKNVWCCANTHIYGFQGWANPNDESAKLTKQQVRQRIKSKQGQTLVQELILQAKLGGPTNQQ